MKKAESLLCLMLMVTSGVLAQKKGEMPFTSSSKNANQSLRNAWVALADFNVKEGNKYTQAVLNEDPNCGMCYVSLFPFESGQLEANIEKAATMNLSDDERLLVEGLIARQEDRPNEEYFEPLLKKYPKDDYLHLWIILNNTNPERAIQIAEDLSKRNAKLGPVYNLLGYLYMNKKDMARAETYFNRYIEVSPKQANPYDSKGDFLMGTGKTEEAIRLYEKAFSLGMAESKVKADEARAKLKYPKLSETDKAMIKTMLSASIDAYDQSDADAVLKDYSQQAVKIWGNQSVNVGMANLRESFAGRFKYAPYTGFDALIESIDGIGSIAVAYGKSESIEKNSASGQETKRTEDFIYLLRKRGDENWKILADHFYGEEESKPLSGEDRKSIEALLSDWDHAHNVGGPMAEQHFPTYAALHSPQIIEIYPNQVTNIGTGNLLARLQFAIGINFEKSSLNPIAIEGRGRRAVAWGIASQIVYPKDADKAISRQYPWAMILTKEKDDVWRVLVVHWAP